MPYRTAPLQLAALNSTNVNVHKLLVEALLTGKKEHVYHAAMMDPNTASVLSLDEIWKMTDELIKAHKGLIPNFKEWIRISSARRNLPILN